MAKIDKVDKALAKKNYELLVDLSKDKDKEVRLAAIDGLASIRDEIGMNTLIMILNDPDVQIRVAAAKGLGKIGNEHAKVHLEFRIKKESDPNVIAAMTECKKMLKAHSA